jgi:hypothetical protein
MQAIIARGHVPFDRFQGVCAHAANPDKDLMVHLIVLLFCFPFYQAPHLWVVGLYLVSSLKSIYNTFSSYANYPGIFLDFLQKRSVPLSFR